MHRRILIFILLITLISGCDEPEQPNDILMVDTLEALPYAEVAPGTDMVIRMTLRNTGSSDVWLLTDKDAKDEPTKYDGDMLLVNYCPGIYTLNDNALRVTSLKENPCQTPPDGYIADLGSSTDLENACYLKFSPDDIHEFEWNLKAPEESMGLTQECGLTLALITGSEAKTISYVYFADPKEVELRRAQDLPAIEPETASSSGPLKIEFSPAGKEPLKSGEPWTAYIKGENSGTGTVRMNNISLESEGYDAGTCDSLDEPLEIIAGTTPTISCILNAPEEVTIMKPYRFEVSAAYTYIQEKTLTIKTNPNL